MLKRRHFTAEFKHRLVEQTCQAGSSIAGLAQANEINANQLHKWRRQILGTSRQRAGARSALLPVAIVPDTAMRPAVDLPSGRIEIELGRARVLLYGHVDLAALNAILSTLRSR